MSVVLLLVLKSLICNLKSDVSLGDSLLAHGFNLEAAKEFRCELYACDSLSPATGLTRMKLGLSLGGANSPALAATELRAAARIAPGLAGPAQVALAGFYANRQSFELAQLELSDLLVFTQGSYERANLNAGLGWLYFRGGDFVSAGASYERAGMSDVAGDLRAAESGPRRNPITATILSSLLPGAGETYAGRPTAGLLSLVVTAASAAGAVWAAKSDDWVSASVIVTALFWRFYNGSRQNAAAMAEEFNTESRRRRAASLRTRLPEPDWFAAADSLLGYELKPDTAAEYSVSGPR